MYFHLGLLIGDAGGVHPVRRWRRQLSQYCPELRVDAESILKGNGSRCWDYGSLAELVIKKEILRKQMVVVVEGSITEVLFDILQQEELLRYHAQAQLTYTYIPEETLYSSPLAYVKADQAWKQAQQAWETWLQAGLVNYSPNMAPVIWKREELRQQTSPNVYRSFTALDDSPMDSQIMSQIVTKAGLKYINLQDSVLALPMLLENKPSLIFLDLVMPLANGYEICTQLRRTSIFKDTPVIIVTGNDGIVDRVRAKIVRSTDFLAKPIDTNKVLAVLRKYLPVPNSVRFGNY